MYPTDKAQLAICSPCWHQNFEVSCMYMCVCVIVPSHCSCFDDVMSLFTPESEDPMNSPFSSGNDLSMIMEDSIDEVFSKETRPAPPPQFKVWMMSLSTGFVKCIVDHLSLSLSLSPPSLPLSLSPTLPPSLLPCHSLGLVARVTPMTVVRTVWPHPLVRTRPVHLSWPQRMSLFTSSTWP